MKTRLIYSSSNGESKLMDDELKTFGIKRSFLTNGSIHLIKK